MRVESHIVEGIDKGSGQVYICTRRGALHIIPRHKMTIDGMAAELCARAGCSKIHCAAI